MCAINLVANNNYQNFNSRVMSLCGVICCATNPNATVNIYGMDVCIIH